MIRCKSISILCVFAVVALSSCRSRTSPSHAARPEPVSPAVKLVPAPLPPSPVPSHAAELRAVWISNPRGMDWPRAMQELRNAGFNTVFVNFNTGGAAFYPSRILPNVAARDEMRLCIDAAHAEGIQVHGKFIVWYMFETTPQYQRRLTREKRLLLTPAGQVLFQGDSTWLNPASKINRQERLAAIREALQGYPMDGVQLDYIRYPDNAGAITSGRRDLITQFVVDVRNEVKRVRPSMPISVCSFYDYNRARNQMGQDWALWAQRGYVDFLCPMNYTRDSTMLDRWIQAQQRLVKGRVPIYPGLAAYKLDSASQLNEQVAVVRRLHSPGFAVFAYNEQFRQQLMPGIRF